MRYSGGEKGEGWGKKTRQEGSGRGRDSVRRPPNPVSQAGDPPLRSPPLHPQKGGRAKEDGVGLAFSVLTFLLRGVSPLFLCEGSLGEAVYHPLPGMNWVGSEYNEHNSGSR